MQARRASTMEWPTPRRDARGDQASPGQGWRCPARRKTRSIPRDRPRTTLGHITNSMFSFSARSVPLDDSLQALNVNWQPRNTMPLFGAHKSIAGGCHNALTAAAELGSDTGQLFTKNNNQWLCKDLTPADTEQFRATLKSTKLKFPTAHNAYLINVGRGPRVHDEIAQSQRLGPLHLDDE